MRQAAWLIGLLVAIVPLDASAQPWTGILSPSRAVDWSNAGVPGGIPNRTTICAALSPGATAAQINSAIAGCPSGQVVSLAAGTYNLTSGIIFNNKSNVTLRGAGPDQTILNFTGYVSCRGFNIDVCFTSGSNPMLPSPSPSVNWTGGYGQDTTTITLSSTTGLQTGYLMILDQLDDTSDTGGMYVCSTTACSEQGGGWVARANRNQQQLVRVTAVNGNQVTISPGVYAPNWRSSQSPGAFWANTQPLTGSGLEDMTLNHANSSAQGGLMFMYAYGSWLKNVKSLLTNRAQVWFYQSARITVRDSYFYGSKAGASQSYGFDFSSTSDMLIENNIVQHFSGHFTINGASSGSVIGYNYAFDDNYAGSWMIGSTSFHDAGMDNILQEGNDCLGCLHADVVHGTHNLMTAFRNRIVGWQSGKTGNTVPGNLYSYNRLFNIVGNVMGQPGYHTTYETTSGSSTTIFRLGTSPGGAIPQDPVVRSTLMRWGNYDTVTGTVRFLAAEVPSDSLAYPNAVPVSQALPNSFYLPGKPAFFGSVAWPPIGPDVTGGTLSGLGGHANKIPARLCYENGAKDSAGVLTAFNANSCYGTSGGGPSLPAAPSNLVVK